MAAIQYLTIDHLSTKDLIRIFSKITIDPAISYNGTPCWIWTGAVARDYSLIWCPHSGKYEKCHRVLFAWAVHPLPRRVKGQKTPQLDHLCKRKLCANPVHLDFVSPQINTLRSDGLAAQNASKAHCVNGHSFDRTKPSGERYCSQCSLLHSQKQRANHPEKVRQWSNNYRARNLEKVRQFQREAARAKRAAQRLTP